MGSCSLKLERMEAVVIGYEVPLMKFKWSRSRKYISLAVNSIELQRNISSVLVMHCISCRRENR